MRGRCVLGRPTRRLAVVDREKIAGDEREGRTYKHAVVSSYVVSFVHAFFLTWAGWSIVFRLQLDLAVHAGSTPFDE